MFQNIHDQMTTYKCIFEVNINGKIQKNIIEAPRLMIENEFINLVQKSINSSSPIMVKMSRTVPIYDNIENKWVYRNNDVVFKNNAYLIVNGE